MQESAQGREIRPVDQLRLRTVTFDDIRAALAAGVRDFFRKPLMSGFFGLVYALFGVVLLLGVAVYGQIWMIMPAGVGFPLVAPFLAAGLYEMSRRYQLGQAFTWGDIFTVIFRQQRREFGWMAFVTLFVFWVWIYQVRLLLALFLQWKSFSTFDSFLTVITSTTEGAMFLGVGTLVGAFLSTVLFSITVISMPLLLDREIDFITAMILSIRTVASNPVVMLSWGVMIAVMVFVSMLPFFAGLIFTLPVLGHTTWHLYKRVVEITG